MKYSESENKKYNFTEIIVFILLFKIIECGLNQ